MRLMGLMGFIGLMALMGLVGCESPSREQLASLAAEGYYRHLTMGEYERFLEGRVDADSLPEDYREQLVAGYKQFMELQRTAHHGIRSVQTTNARMDSTLQLMQVFLLLEYGDSTLEEIVVPMVEHDGRWRMR